jgi:hypothetical protein
MDGICEHLRTMPLDDMPDGGCIDCLKIGDTWVHLRYCVTCKMIRCCDDSKNQHSRKHWLAVGHGVMRSKEPGEFWAYCYPDDSIVNTNKL